MLNRKEDSTGRLAILSVLERMAAAPDFPVNPPAERNRGLKEYYRLTQQDRVALVNGDTRRIQGWVGSLDKHLSTWLYGRLLPEKR